MIADDTADLGSHFGDFRPIEGVLALREQLHCTPRFRQSRFFVAEEGERNGKVSVLAGIAWNGIYACLCKLFGFRESHTRAAFITQTLTRQSDHHLFSND